MNDPHQGARPGVHSRERIVARVLSGQSAVEVAAAFAESERTVRKWLARFRAGGQAALSCHASAPARVSGRLAQATVALIVHLRRTLRREWAYGLAHPTSAARIADLPRWLDWFNRSRPHSALNGLSPLTSVNNLMKTHS
jgi:transposase InsO family protein